jgi:multidrug efflux pump
VVFVGTFALFVRFNHGVEFFPESIPPAQLIVDIEAPVGTRVAFTDGVARAWRRRSGDSPASWTWSPW